jgi:hypothetical protein
MMINDDGYDDDNDNKDEDSGGGGDDDDQINKPIILYNVRIYLVSQATT